MPSLAKAKILVEATGDAVAIVMAGKLIPVPNPRDLHLVMEEIDKEKPTFVPGVPRFFAGLNESPLVKKVGPEAAAEGKPFAHHMKHLAVHGFLHVLGYDHESDEDADAMERLERAILARLGVPDPYIARDAEG